MKLRSSLGSDYGVHYLLASCTGLLELHERSDLVQSLHWRKQHRNMHQVPNRGLPGAACGLGLWIKHHCWRRLAAAIPGSHCNGAAVLKSVILLLNRNK